MMLVEIGQAVWGSAARAVDAIALAPTPAPEPKTINTDAVLNFFTTKIVPILLAALGVIFIGRASKGEVSRVLTSSAIAIIGLAFVAGAASLFFFGDSLVNLIFK
ncbi:hypothetical protein AB0M46_20650 [Dactylosporangium sp. NPDC051485]|uniref:hypothetical protein n=1 Tax=Dactylosporangium sp. NPDC051485 TaxID=3154846 RepID=UPI00341202A3